MNKCSADAIEANAIVNMKIESKKLRLSEDKCAQIHVSRKNTAACDTFLKVHEGKMKKVEEGTYLGDILSADGALDKTIENRRQKGVGICSQITGMMNSVSLGFFFFRISFTLRDEDDDLLNRVYQAQKVVKIKNDWAELIENYKKEIFQ